MKDILKNGVTLFVCILISGLMCFICQLSMKMIFNFMFTETIGYQVQGTLGDSKEKEYLYTYIYEDGDVTGANDTKWAEYEKEGYTLYKYAERTQISNGTTITMLIITQIICLFSAILMIFPSLMNRGYKDGTLVRSGNRKPDQLKGLKISLIGCVPALITFVVFLVFAVGTNKGVAVELYMIANALFWPILELLLKSAPTAGDITILQFVAMFLIQMIVPLIGAVSYYMGYKDYQFLSKVVYKKKKKG